VDENSAVSASDPLDETQSPNAGDLARRVHRRRTELGKSIEEVAERAGVDPAYLRYFENSADARLSAGTMLLLAMTLDSTPEELYGGRVMRPPGPGRPGPHAELRELTPEQCASHLEVGGVGRAVFLTERGPVAHPLNFVTSDGDVVVSTTAAHAAQIEASERVSFQIDRVDEAMSEGWSVLVTGKARRVDDPEELVALSELDLEPWAGGNRHALVRIRPDVVTGRVICQ
jgi:nitroimidazol reductase NimA-like FMN-containing flavoprotein (pyridoxamine 5'-phosphate oxidase superfamily)